MSNYGLHLIFKRSPLKHPTFDSLYIVLPKTYYWACPTFPLPQNVALGHWMINFAVIIYKPKKCSNSSWMNTACIQLKINCIPQAT